MTTAPSTNGTCRILLIRHAVSRGHGRFCGHTDVPLAPAARRQLSALVQKVSRYRVQAVYSSDLARAYATAMVIARTLGIEIIVRPALREMRFGRWEGLSWREVTARFPRLSEAWIARFPNQPIPGAERFSTFKKRATRELRDIVAANAGGCAAVVTHAGVARVLLAGALGIPDRDLFRIAVDPSALSMIDFSRNGATVRSMND